ncbi:unnamed protein product [Calicophoron daubneyi]|uniref:C2 domain-containing protein n=1 Tax=Calicophoron daubneyi TaxID=300641 RepID=A0AAV2T2W6_CALDB
MYEHHHFSRSSIHNLHVMPVIEKAHHLASVSIVDLSKGKRHHHRHESSMGSLGSGHSKSRHLKHKMSRVYDKFQERLKLEAAKSVGGRRSKSMTGLNDDTMYDEIDVDRKDSDTDNATGDSPTKNVVLRHPERLAGDYSARREGSYSESLAVGSSAATAGRNPSSVYGAVVDTRRLLSLPRNDDYAGSQSSGQNSPAYDSVYGGSMQGAQSTYETREGKRSVLPREGYFWQIRLFLKRAKNLPVKNTRGKVDPCVKVRYRGKRLLQTMTVFNDRNPVWDEKYRIPIINLEYPLEIRVYNRNEFKKNEYIGRAQVALTCLNYGLPQEFTLPLEDELGRSHAYLGEVNFWMTLSEISENSVLPEHRKALIRQLKIDRQILTQLPKISSAAPPDMQTTLGPSTMQQSASVHSFVRSDSLPNLPRDTGSEHGVDEVVDLEDDEWVGENVLYFYYPRWPMSFYYGTKLEMYTYGLKDRTDPLLSNLFTTWGNNKNELNLENFYAVAKLVVTLVRAEDLEMPAAPQDADETNDLKRTSSKKQLIRGRNLEKMVLGAPITQASGVPPSPMARLMVGKTTLRSPVIKMTQNPFWHQEFIFNVRLGEKTILRIEICDSALAFEPLLVRSYLDFSHLLPDWTECFTLKNNLEGKPGSVVILATLTGFTRQMDLPHPDLAPVISGSPLSDNRNSENSDELQPVPISSLRLPKDLMRQVEEHYAVPRTLGALDDVGWLHISVHCAREVVAPERSKRSDPFVVIRLSNRCVHTSTCFRTANPTWNQSFVLPIGDMYDILQVTVMNASREEHDVIGRLAFPLVQIMNRKLRWYALKERKLMKRVKGCILLETYIVYNPVRAAMRAAYPTEQQYVWRTNKVRLKDLLTKYVPSLQQTIERITPYGTLLQKLNNAATKLYSWENPIQSTLFLVGTSLAILFVQPSMILGFILLAFCASYVATAPWFKSHFQATSSTTPTKEKEENEYEEISMDFQDMDDDTFDTDGSDSGLLKRKKSKRKPLKAKLEKARQALATLQTSMEHVASMLEKLEGIFRWKVPWLTWLMFLFLLFIGILMFFIPVRYLIVFFFAKRFTKKLRRAHLYDASPMAIISRVPDRIQTINFRELRPTVAHSGLVRIE